ncbi:hypothetical protein TIFTF001_032276, partial [Ficus carica]
MIVSDSFQAVFGVVSDGQFGCLSPTQVALFRRIFRRSTGWPGVTPLCGISRFALGRAGGLCVAWKEGVEIEPWLVDKNTISCIVYSDSPFQPWSFSAMYGPPMGACKRIGCDITVDVWEDPWNPSLEGYKPFPLDSLSKQMVFFVRDLFSTSGGWDVVKLRALDGVISSVLWKKVWRSKMHPLSQAVMVEVTSFLHFSGFSELSVSLFEGSLISNLGVDAERVILFASLPFGVCLEREKYCASKVHGGDRTSPVKSFFRALWRLFRLILSSLAVVVREETPLSQRGVWCFEKPDVHQPHI